MTTTQTVTMQEVAAFIGAATREEVGVIFDLCRTRDRIASRIESSLNASLLKAGDRVRIKSISPKYLIGDMATVEGPGRKPGFINIKLDRNNGKFSAAYPIGCPAGSLEKVG